MASASLKIAEHILARAADRHVLLQQIENTQYAKGSLVQVGSEFNDLQRKYWAASEVCSDLSSVTDREKEFEKLRGSLFQKLLKRDKYNANLKKDEDDYIGALSSLEKATVKRDLLRKEVDAMKKRRDDIQKTAMEYDQALIALDDFYQSVFNGPTPETPEEDTLEEAVETVQKEYNAVQTRLMHAADVVNNLCLAEMRIRSALPDTASALNMPSHNTIGTDDISGPVRSNFRYTNHKERRELSRAQRQIAEGEHFMAIAQEMDPKVGAFFRPEVADGESGLGVLNQIIDTPITDYLFRSEVKSPWDGVQSCGILLAEERHAADDRRAAIKKEKGIAAAAIKEAREQLLDVRTKIFERTLQLEGDKC